MRIKPHQASGGHQHTESMLMVAAFLALAVIVLGAYVRLADAGLACPDWPGCYGHWVVPNEPEARQHINVQYPEQPLVPAKAWIEMTHRYLAAVLGLMALVLAWRLRHDEAARRAAGWLAGLIVAQGLLGMLTVTQLLNPVIVTAHLLGGMTVLAVLVWLNLCWRTAVRGMGRRWPRGPLWTAVASLLVVQIALGGWTSANDAVLACGGFPQCQGQWVPELDFAAAFDPQRDYAASDEGLATIHWSHRVGAIALLVMTAALRYRARRDPRAARWLNGVLLLLAAQAALGISNVVLARPLALAVMHNAMAALIVAGFLTAAWRAQANVDKEVPKWNKRYSYPAES